MNRYAILCAVDRAKLDLFAAMRAEHYRFLIERREAVLFGGPTRETEAGAPETMIMVVEAASIEAAHVFIAAEPYNRAGGFSRVDVRPWSQVLPELEPGRLDRTLAGELGHGGGSPAAAGSTADGKCVNNEGAAP